jgi:NAD+ diphosphatase
MMPEPIYLPMARSAVDRDYLSRKLEDLYGQLDADSSTKVLPIYNGKVLLVGSVQDTRPALKFFETSEIPSASYLAYLGKSDGAHELAEGTSVILADLDETLAVSLEPNPENWHALRRTGAGLSDLGIGLYTQALALANWHKTHSHCPKCGAVTEIIDAGWVRRCSVDGSELYPRTDPAIIVGVTDHQDRILLGSQGVWEENRWSVLAGFVEPGESLEAAVIREMFEESGLRVTNPRYLGSQAWPFPYSLMQGFTAKLADDSDGVLKPDGEEIEKLRWFSREDIAREAGQLLLPGRLTISRAIIEHWFGGEITSASELA